MCIYILIKLRKDETKFRRKENNDCQGCDANTIQTLQNAGNNNIMKTNFPEAFIFGKVETRLGH